MKIYLADPISGRDFTHVFGDWEMKVSELERLGYDVLWPLVAKGYLLNVGKAVSSGYHQPPSTDRAIYGRDMWMVDQADVVFVDLTAGSERVSIGSMFELAWAVQQPHTHTVVVLPPDNIHNHAFVLQAADVIYTTRQDAIVYLEKLIQGVF